MLQKERAVGRSTGAIDRLAGELICEVTRLRCHSERTKLLSSGRKQPASPLQQQMPQAVPQCQRPELEQQHNAVIDRLETDTLCGLRNPELLKILIWS